MNYACDECGFVFRRIGAVERCPICDGIKLREANRQEQDALEKWIAKERGEENRQEKKKE